MKNHRLVDRLRLIHIMQGFFLKNCFNLAIENNWVSAIKIDAPPAEKPCKRMVNRMDNLILESFCYIFPHFSCQYHAVNNYPFTCKPICIGKPLSIEWQSILIWIQRDAYFTCCSGIIMSKMGYEIHSMRTIDVRINVLWNI